MYAITERNSMAGVGSIQSSSQCRLWIDRCGDTTPCSDMAAQYETQEEAEAAMEAAGLDTSDSGWFCVVELSEE